MTKGTFHHACSPRYSFTSGYGITLKSTVAESHKYLHHEQTNLKRQIADAHRRIDRLVYDLYSLTDEEIRIIEKD